MIDMTQTGMFAGAAELRAAAHRVGLALNALNPNSRCIRWRADDAPFNENVGWCFVGRVNVDRRLVRTGAERREANI